MCFIDICSLQCKPGFDFVKDTPYIFQLYGDDKMKVAQPPQANKVP